MLTKSLHTVTAATNVARLLADDSRTIYRDGAVLAASALRVLGYNLPDYLGGSDDVTVTRIIAACNKILLGLNRRAA